MTTIAFNYSLSDGYINTQFIETGVKLSRFCTIQVLGSDLTSDARSAYVALKTTRLGEFDTHPTTEMVSQRLLELLETAVDKAEKLLQEFEHESIDHLLNLAFRRNSLPTPSLNLDSDSLKGIHYDDRVKAVHQAVCDAAITRYEGYLQKLEPLDDTDLAIRAVDTEVPMAFLVGAELRVRYKELVGRYKDAVEASKDARKLAAQQEIDDWIAAHGSDRLAKAYAQGYECKRLYAKERASLEYPDFELDYMDNLEYVDRINPSLEALELSEQYAGSEVVWVKARHDESDDYATEQEEAVILKNFLGRYTLVKYLGDPGE